jgi:hypothetical protein
LIIETGCVPDWLDLHTFQQNLSCPLCKMEQSLSGEDKKIKKITANPIKKE